MGSLGLTSSYFPVLTTLFSYIIDFPGVFSNLSPIDAQDLSSEVCNSGDKVLLPILQPQGGLPGVCR